MPNIHNIAFPLDKYGLTNKDYTGSPTIFFPIDEPHGMIKVSLLYQLQTLGIINLQYYCRLWWKEQSQDYKFAVEGTCDK